jgi:hypothetical protein
LCWTRQAYWTSSQACRPQKNGQKKNRLNTQKIAKAAPRAAVPVVFVGHCAHLSPERAGLQAVGAIIWCAVLAGFRQDR